MSGQTLTQQVEELQAKVDAAPAGPGTASGGLNARIAAIERMLPLTRLAMTPPARPIAPLFGGTASRPISPSPWTFYGDTDLGIPIWWNSAAWIDATGTPV